MCDKHSKIIIEVSEWNEVYIIKYITKSLNKFALISAVYILHLKIVFSAAVSDTSLHNIMTDSLNINTVSLNEKIKAYKL